ncbi:MAG: ABC transporter permease subunit [Planctomycetota bacterium]|nr:ABC transporter permease subunit [Planctomycetota bacterium]
MSAAATEPAGASHAAGQTGSPGFSLRRVLTSLPGPIFFKELNTAGRRTSTYWLRGIFALGLTALVSMVFLGNYLDTYESTGAARIQRFQTLAPITTDCVVWFEFVALNLAAAARCGGAICDERRNGSLASLLTTPLRTYQIILGKVFGGMAELMLLALTGLPLLLAVRFFGGLTLEALAACYAIIISSILLTCATTVLASIFTKRAPTAMLSALGIVAAMQFAPIIAIGIGQWFGLPVKPAWIFEISSPFTLGMVTAMLVFGASGPVGIGAAVTWWYSPIYVLLLTVLVVAIAIVALRRSVAREANGGGAVAVAVNSSDPAKPRRRKFWQPVPRRQPGTSRTVGDQPVLWREGQQVAPFFSRATVYRILAIGFLLALVWYDNQPSSGSIQIFIAAACTTLAMITAAGSSAAGISAERESQTLDVLLMTPLSAREIVWGKFMGNVKRLWFFPAVLMVHHTVIACGLGGMSPVTLLMYPFILLPPMAMLCASGVWLSAWSKKTGTASAANFGVAVIGWLGLPLLCAFIGEMLLSGRTAGKLASIAALLNPVGHAIIATVAGTENQQDLQFHVYDLGRIGPVGYSLLLAAYTAIFCLATFGLLRLASAYLCRTTNRAR